MSKTFRDWEPDQVWLLPPSLQDLVPTGHVAHFVRDTVRNGLDLETILASYGEERGFPPYHPGMMVALLLYGYSQGVYSSRRIARGCEERLDFAAVTAMQRPDFRTISDFRKRHSEALRGLFVQVLRLCREAGLVKLGHVALDGTKLKANASKHKAMSYARMVEAEPKLAAEVAAWRRAARRRDAGLGGEQGAAAGEDPRSQGGARSRGASRCRGQTKWPRQAAARHAGGQGATQFYRSAEPDHEDQGRLHPGLQCAGRGRRHSAGHRRRDAQQSGQRLPASGGAGRADREQPRGRPRAGFRRCRLLLGGQSGSARKPQDRRAYRHRAAQARRHRAPSAAFPAAQPGGGDGGKTLRGRSPGSLSAAQAGRRAGVRADQTGARLPAIPAAWSGRGAERMVADLHRPQPLKTRRGAPSAATRDDGFGIGYRECSKPPVSRSPTNLGAPPRRRSPQDTIQSVTPADHPERGARHYQDRLLAVRA